MNRSTAARILADSEQGAVNARYDSGNDPPMSSLSEILDPLKQQARGAAYAAASRLAGRINAASVSDEELQSLLDERKRLVMKKLYKSISPSESRRLTYVRWSLDRIEDARHGENLDRLEAAVQQYETFQNDLSILLRNLDKQAASKGRKR